MKQKKRSDFSSTDFSSDFAIGKPQKKKPTLTRENTNTLVSQPVIQRMMDKAIAINAACSEECRDFQIMTSPMREKTLILRWMTINIEDVDRPVQQYHYECFELDGTPQNCSVNYSNQDEANRFFRGLQLLYKQTFANDHRL